MIDNQEGVFLSKKDQITFNIIEKFRLGKLSRKDAALKLNVCERTISRVVSRIKKLGFKGLKHGNCKKVPVNKIPEKLVKKYVDLYKERYSKFNFSHALEMIAHQEGLEEINYQKFRRACRKEGLGKVKRRRTSKARVARERMANEGHMWQMDGSPEKWNGEEEWSLIALIDDATSLIPGADFSKSETTWACMNVVREAIEKFGRPEFILTDKAGWAKGTSKRSNFSQFSRACDELGITVITTSSPESKGRIERANRTFQDRLIPELDLHDIKTMKDCRRYLKQVFLPGWDEKFSVVPRSDENRYEPIPDHIDLRNIFCIKYQRVVLRDHTISYQNERYKLIPKSDESFKGKEVTVHQYEDKSIAIFYAGRRLEHQYLAKPVKRGWFKGVG
jgi:transposase-like protein